MNDQSPMPFGTHKGLPLIKVPADYLLFLLYENKCYGELRKYIEENQDSLESEAGNRAGKKVK